jgi:hypothetical protein
MEQVGCGLGFSSGKGWYIVYLCVDRCKAPKAKEMMLCIVISESDFSWLMKTRDTACTVCISCVCLWCKLYPINWPSRFLRGAVNIVIKTDFVLSLHPRLLLIFIHFLCMYTTYACPRAPFGRFLCVIGVCARMYAPAYRKHTHT